MRTMDPGYPKPITIWKGIPDSPQGAFVDKANGIWIAKIIGICKDPHKINSGVESIFIFPSQMVRRFIRDVK